MTAPPRCPHCYPKWMVSPTGGGWFHRRGCPRVGQKVDMRLAAAIAAHPVSHVRLSLVPTLDRGSDVIPISVSGLPDTDRCPAHPLEDRWECPACNALGEGWQT